jgi:hypothetical protein
MAGAEREPVSDPAIPAPDDTGAFEAYVSQLVRELESWVNVVSSGPHVCNLPTCKMRRYGL